MNNMFACGYSCNSKDIPTSPVTAFAQHHQHFNLNDHNISSCSNPGPSAMPSSPTIAKDTFTQKHQQDCDGPMSTSTATTTTAEIENGANSECVGFLELEISSSEESLKTLNTLNDVPVHGDEIPTSSSSVVLPGKSRKITNRLTIKNSNNAANVGCSAPDTVVDQKTIFQQERNRSKSNNNIGKRPDPIRVDVLRPFTHQSQKTNLNSSSDAVKDSNVKSKLMSTDKDTNTNDKHGEDDRSRSPLPPSSLRGNNSKDNNENKSKKSKNKNVYDGHESRNEDDVLDNEKNNDTRNVNPSNNDINKSDTNKNDSNENVINENDINDMNKNKDGINEDGINEDDKNKKGVIGSVSIESDIIDVDTKIKKGKNCNKVEKNIDHDNSDKDKKNGDITGDDNNIKKSKKDVNKKVGNAQMEWEKKVFIRNNCNNNLQLRNAQTEWNKIFNRNKPERKKDDKMKNNKSNNSILDDGSKEQDYDSDDNDCNPGDKESIISNNNATNNSNILDDGMKGQDYDNDDCKPGDKESIISATSNSNMVRCDESQNGGLITYSPDSLAPHANNITSRATNNKSVRMQSHPNSFSNTKALETLMKRLENGFQVTLHDGQSLTGKAVIISLRAESPGRHDRKFLMIQPFGSEDNDDEWMSVKFPIRSVQRLEIGKTNSSVLSTSMYNHIHSMTCFSIVVRLWTTENYFDFEASSVIEREALISTLMVVLDQTHEKKNSRNEKTDDNIGKGTNSDTTNMIKIDTATSNPGEAKKCKTSTINNQVEIKLKNSSRSNIKDSDDDDDGNDNDGAPSFSATEALKAPGKEIGNGYSKLNSTEEIPKYPLVPPSENATEGCSTLKQTRIHYCADSDFGEGAEISLINNNSDSEIESSNHEEDKQSFQKDKIQAETRDAPPSGVHVTADKKESRDKNFQCAPNFCQNEFNFDASKIEGSWCVDDICTLAIRDMADMCTGIFENKQNKQEADPKAVEEFISSVLGARASAMVSFLTDGDAWAAQSSGATKSEAANGAGGDSKKANPCNSKFKNRAGTLNAQALRLKTLRNEMTFAAAVQRSKKKMHYRQTIKSFDDAEQSRKKSVVEKFHSSPLFEQVVGSMIMTKPNNVVDSDQELCYYDSDPEDTRLRETKRGPRRAIAERLNKVDSDDEPEERQMALSGVGFENIVMGKKLRKTDENIIFHIIQAMRNESFTLIWHPTQTKQLPSKSPVCINLWIESGVYLYDGSFLLPRLAWTAAYEKNLESKKLNVSKEEPEQVVLLDICRVRPTSKINRKQHPFPDAKKSFTVETQDELFLFETQSSEERNRVVYALKLVIARLASLLMLRDIRALEEFFGTAPIMGPGLAPAFIQNPSEATTTT